MTQQPASLIRGSLCLHVLHGDFLLIGYLLDNLFNALCSIARLEVVPEIVGVFVVVYNLQANSHASSTELKKSAVRTEHGSS